MNEIQHVTRQKHIGHNAIDKNTVVFEMDVHNKCNLNCSYCEMQKNDWNPTNDTEDWGKTNEDLKGVQTSLNKISRLLTNKTTKTKLHLLGGEPILNKELPDFLSGLDKDIIVKLFTNGTTFSINPNPPASNQPNTKNQWDKFFDSTNHLNNGIEVAMSYHLEQLSHKNPKNKNNYLKQRFFDTTQLLLTKYNKNVKHITINFLFKDLTYEMEELLETIREVLYFLHKNESYKNFEEGDITLEFIQTFDEDGQYKTTTHTAIPQMVGYDYYDTLFNKIRSIYKDSDYKKHSSSDLESIILLRPLKLLSMTSPHIWSTVKLSNNLQHQSEVQLQFNYNHNKDIPNQKYEIVRLCSKNLWNIDYTGTFYKDSSEQPIVLTNNYIQNIVTDDRLINLLTPKSIICCSETCFCPANNPYEKDIFKVYGVDIENMYTIKNTKYLRKHFDVQTKLIDLNET